MKFWKKKKEVVEKPAVRPNHDGIIVFDDEPEEKKITPEALSRFESWSGTWKYIVEKTHEKIGAYHLELEADLTESQTARIRGRIAELRETLKMAD